VRLRELLPIARDFKPAGVHQVFLPPPYTASAAIEGQDALQAKGVGVAGVIGRAVGGARGGMILANDEAIAKVAMLVAGRGNATTESVRAFTMDEVRKLV